MTKNNFLCDLYPGLRKIVLRISGDFIEHVIFTDNSFTNIDEWHTFELHGVYYDLHIQEEDELPTYVVEIYQLHDKDGLLTSDYGDESTQNVALNLFDDVPEADVVVREYEFECTLCDNRNIVYEWAETRFCSYCGNKCKLAPPEHAFD